jgi:hypothetical protein
MYIEIYTTAEPLVSDLSLFSIQIATAKLKRCGSSGIDQIPAILIQAGGEALQYGIHKDINYTWN